MKFDNFFEVERIISKKKVRNKLFYLIKWKDYSSKENTWEPIKNVKNIK